MHEELKDRLDTRILVVDDQQASRDATMSLLSLKGYRCEGCATGEEALERLAAAEGGFPVCILDLVLDEAGGTLSGMDTLTQIRVKHSATRVIVFTAHADKGQEAVEKGASFYLHKPVSPYHVVNLVDALVKMRQLEDNIALTADRRDTLQRTIDAIGVEIMVRDLNHNILLLNETKKRSMRLDDNAIGKKCYNVLENRCDKCEGCPVDLAARRKEIVQEEWPYDGRTLLINAGPVYDKAGNVVAVAEVVVDITRRKKTIQVLEKIQNAAMDSVDAVAQLVVEALHDIGYDRVRLYLMEGDAPIGRACRGMPAGFEMTEIRLRTDDILAAKAFKAGKAVLFDQSNLEEDRCRKMIHKEGVTHQIQVPLISGGAKVGLVSIDNKHSRRPFTDEDLDTIRLLGAAIADAMRNALAHEEDTREIRWLQGVRDIDRQLARAAGPESVFDAVAKTLTELLVADSALVLFRGDAEGPLSTGARFGDLGDMYIGPHPGTVGVVGRCLRENKTQIVHSPSEDDDFRAFHDWLPEGTAWKRYVGKRKALLVVPVRCGEEPIGACVVHFGKDFTLTRREEEFVEDIAGRVAIALAKLEEQRQIEAATIEAAKLSDLSIMVSGVAHAIRNPLATAASSIEVAQSEEMSGFAAEKLSEAHCELMSTAMTIDRLLSWTRTAGDVPAAVSLREIVEELHSIVEQKLKDSNITFTLEAAEDVRPAFVSPDRVKMAILDLFVNAQTAMPDYGTLQVRIHDVPGKEAVELSISDTGCGMTKEQVQQLFDRGYVTRPAAGGTGLGLYLAQKIIAAAGGAIRCESEPGKGSTFTVELPTMKEDYA